jgi:excisionase family DNA binding protein
MDVDLDKEVFTTFEAAKICNANITSIKNWIDKGELRAFRTPGGHYRIERKVLEDFLNRHSMPNPFAEHERRRVLIIHHDPGWAEGLAGHFGSQYDYDATDDPQQALLTIGQWRPNVAVIDDRIEGIDLLGLCATIKETPELRTVSVIAVHERDPSYTERLKEAGCDHVVTPLDDDKALYEAVRRALL